MTVPHIRHTNAAQRQQLADVATSIGTARALLIEMRSECESALLAHATQHAEVSLGQPGAQQRRLRLAEEAQTIRWSLQRLDGAIDALSAEQARTVRGLRP